MATQKFSTLKIDDEFDTNSLGVVCSQYPYGYLGDTVSPCIFLTLTDIGDWEPEPITEEDFESENFSSSSFLTFLESQSNKDQVFIDCSSTSDIQIQYFPASRGFETKYFPITDGSNVPIVAIQVSGLGPEMTHNIKCKAYYKGVKFSKEDEYKSVVNFKLEMIE